MTPTDRTEAAFVGVLLLSLALIGLLLLVDCDSARVAEPLPGGVAGERRYDAPCPAPRPQKRGGVPDRWTPPPRTALDDCLAFGECR